MEGAAEFVTREGVERWWRDCIGGRRSRLEASEWAEDQLDRSDAMEELVLQGLLELQRLQFQDGDAQTASRFERWQAELHQYDEDPEAWNRGYFQRILVRFLDRHGVERTRSFGRRMVADGFLTDQDVKNVLRG